MIIDTLPGLINEALKSKDELRLNTLKMLLSSLKYEKIAKQHDLSEEEELSVVKSEAKKRRDAIAAYEKASATDRVEHEKKELAILEVMLPAEMSDEELEKIVLTAVEESGAKTKAEMGKVMGLAMRKIAGQASGDRVSAIVMKNLT